MTTAVAEHEATTEPKTGDIEPAKPQSPATVQGGPRGLVLRSLDDMYRFAKYVHASGLAPSALRTPEACFVAIQMGAECGLPPMAALQNIAVINGRPSIWGDAQMAICRASGAWIERAHKEWYDGDGNDFAAHCQVARAGGEPHVSSFSIADAQTAGLWGKTGPWTQYPKDMLMWRARSRAMKAKFPDALRGFAMVEEVRDFIDIEATSVVAKLPAETPGQSAKEKARAKVGAKPKPQPEESKSDDGAPQDDAPTPEPPADAEPSEASSEQSPAKRTGTIGKVKAAELKSKLEKLPADSRKAICKQFGIDWLKAQAELEQLTPEQSQALGIVIDEEGGK